MTEKGSGRIELICGPMFAGKTTILLKRLAAAQNRGLEVVGIKPAAENRYSDDEIVTHTGEAISATTITTGDSLVQAAGQAEVVGIDEAHFFDVALADGCRILAKRGVRVIVAGVDLDHHGKPFEVMVRLQQMAVGVMPLTARCAICNKPARYTQRLIAKDDRIIVGGAGEYEPRCGNCFNPFA